MTDPMPPSDASDQVARAVRDLLPALKRRSVIAVGVIAAAAVVSGVLALLSLSSLMETEDRWKMAMFAVLGGGIVIAAAWQSCIRAQEALVMPILAQSIGLTYSKDARQFVRHLPSRLLPERSVRSGEDLVRGALGNHAIQMAEVKAETGGKNSRTLFQGIVAQFPNRTAMPAFFLALADKTRPGMVFRSELSTDGLYHLRSVTGGGGRSYGIWTSWTQMQEPPALAAVVEILARIEDHVGPFVELYAATSNGEEMHIALSHKRNLFRLGSLFPTEPELFANARIAIQDLSVPLILAKALIEAEETASGKAAETAAKS